MSTPTTFDLSAVLRALGARTSASVPNVATGQLLPVVVLGDFSNTFAPETIEARGLTQGNPVSAAAGTWSGVYLQSLAPGGIVVELISQPVSNYPTMWFRCDEVPWAGGSFLAVFPIGGGTVLSRWNTILNEPNPPPVITNLRGGATYIGGLPLGLGVGFDYSVFERWWIPPGSFLGAWASSPGMDCPTIRFREIPQEQGPI